MDPTERSYTTLVGEPKDAEWPLLIARATEKFREAQEKLAKFEAAVEHRRGAHYALHTGISIGSGQQVRRVSPAPSRALTALQRVGNLKNTVRRQKIIDDLKNDLDILRIANFGSGACPFSSSRCAAAFNPAPTTGGLKNYVPNVYQLYGDTLDALEESDPQLKRNFNGNVFAAATFNLGPRVTTYPHLDHLNFAFGMCAITALGNYDYKKGGHIILWDAKLIIEFPPGSTILIPSAILRHSNVAVAQGETRYSLTQYSAGGLFRWVKCGFRTLKAYRAAGYDLKSEYEEWKEGWRMYPTASELRGTPAAPM